MCSRQMPLMRVNVRHHVQSPPHELLGMATGQAASMEAMHLPTGSAEEDEARLANNPGMAMMREMTGKEEDLPPLERVERLGRGIALGAGSHALEYGTKADAREAFERAVAANPRCSDARLGLLLAFPQKDLSWERRADELREIADDAVAQLHEIHGVPAGQPLVLEWTRHEVRAVARAISSHAMVLDHLGRLEEAAEQLERLCTLVPTAHHGAQEHAVSVLTQLGKLRRARDLEQQVGGARSLGVVWSRVLRFVLQRKFNGAAKALRLARTECGVFEKYLLNPKLPMPRPDKEVLSFGWVRNTESQVAVCGFPARRAWQAFPLALVWLGSQGVSCADSPCCAGKAKDAPPQP